MPAAAVIPAPIAYIKVVAVKKLVVEPLGRPGGPAFLYAVYCLSRGWLVSPICGSHAPIAGGVAPVIVRGRLTHFLAKLCVSLTGCLSK